MKKRILSILLTVLMVVSMLPMTVFAADCDHVSTTKTAVDNGDGTHAVTVTCDICGEEVRQEGKTINMDFKAFAQAAAQQSWWADLPMSAAGSNNTRYLGVVTNVSPDATAVAAYESLAAWAKETYGWTIDETVSGFKSYWKCLYINADAADYCPWGVSMYTYYHGSERSKLGFTVTAEEAGWYQMDMSVFKEGSSWPNIGGTIGSNSGGDIVDVYVNDEIVLDDYDLCNTSTTYITVNENVGLVYLNEGDNSVVFDSVKSYNGTTSGGRSNVPLNSITFTQDTSNEGHEDANEDGKCDGCAAVTGECKHKESTQQITANGNKTHTVKTVCAACGETVPGVAEDEIITVDFMTFGKEAAQQTWWTSLPAAGDENTRYIGVVSNTTMTDEAKAAYEEMTIWSKQTYGWAIDEDVSGFGEHWKTLYISSSDDVPFGVNMWTYYHGTSEQAHRSKLALTVTADQAGWYTFDMAMLKQNSSWAACSNATGMGTGGDRIALSVNGESVYYDYSLYNKTNGAFTEDFGLVYLKAGDNSVVIDSIYSYNDTDVGGRSNVPLKSLTFSKVQTNFLPGSEGTIAMADLLDFSQSVDTAVCTVTSSDEEVATAAFDANGDLAVSALTEGEAVLTVADAETAEIAKVGVTVATGVIVSCVDADEDGKCDVCDALTGTCKHSNTTTVTSNGNETHTTTIVCSKCGSYALAEDEQNVITVDFKALAKTAAAQEWWTDLRAAGDDNTKYVGLPTTNDEDAMTAANREAYAALQAQAGESGWCIDEEVTNLTGLLKRVYFNSSDDVPWGLSWYSYYQGGDNPDLSKLGFTIKADEAGWYSLDMSAFKENSVYYVGNNLRSNGGGTSGGGTVDVYINGEKIHSAYSFESTNKVVEDCMGIVYLNKGENALVLEAVHSYNGATVTKGGRFNVALSKLTFTELDVPVMLPGAEKTVSLEGFLAFNETAASAVSQNETVATAVLADNNLTVSGLTEGNTAITISDGNAVAVCEVPVLVTNTITDDCTDADHDQLCDLCGGDVECIHENTTTTVVDNEDKTHTVIVACDDCGETQSMELNDCTDANEDGKCDVCEAVIGICAHKDVEKEITYNGDGTHTVAAVCNNCGAIVVENTAVGASIAGDTMQIVQAAKAANASDWAKLPTTDVDGIIRLGALDDSQEMSYTQLLAAYNICNWLEANSVFSMVADQGFHNPGSKKRVFLNTNEDANWGLRFDAFYFGMDNWYSGLQVVIKADKAGTYAFTLDVFNETTSSADLNMVDGSRTGGHGDIYVNDVLVYENYHFTADATGRVSIDLGAVELNEGSNSLVLHMTSDYFGSTVGGNSSRRAVNLRSVEFNEILPSYAALGQDTTIALDDYLAFDETVSAQTHTATSSNTAVATVAIDAAGNLVVSGLTEGDVTVTVSDANGTVAEVEVSVVSATVETCVDEDGDNVCDICGVNFVCAHANTTKTYTANGNETHNMTETCTACGETVSTQENVACSDADNSIKCDYCYGDVACTHPSNLKSETVTANDNGTHTITVSCYCGEELSSETADCADEDADGTCDVCGATIVELTMVNVGGSNMTLGNDLKMNFMVKTAELQDGLTMRVTQDGKDPVVLTPEKYNSTYHYVAYSVAAKEMTDVLTVEVLNADGNVVSDPYTRTIAYYATNLLTKSTSTDKLKSVAVDMLNYGTEAQKYFSYNEDDYANANISTEDQEAYATTGATCDVQRILGTNAAGTNLSLEASILLNVFFNSTTTDGMTATVTYTNYKGAEVTAEAAVEKYSSSRVKVVVDEIVLADTKRPVTVTVYKDGAEYGSCTEAVGGYATRKLTDEAMGSICQAILNFATSAYTYLGGTH